MVNSVAELFASREGEGVYKRSLSFMTTNGMDALVSGGVLIGLSGGADSVFLSLLIHEYRRRTNQSFSVLAVHINHMIREDEADRDECLSRGIAESLGFEFESYKIDVPVVRYDTAPTIARIFGAATPDVWRGRAIEEIFE